MRWKGFIFLIVVSTIFLVISMVFMDRWIESGLEKIGQTVVGAKVEIDHLHVDALKLSFMWDRLQVTDPNHTMQNLIETGRTVFQMNMPALLRKRVVIQEMSLVDLRSGTSRETDGALPKKPKPPRRKKKSGPFDKLKNRLKKDIENLPVMQFNLDQIKKKLNLDSLVVMTELKTPEKLDSAKHDILVINDRWVSFFKTFHPEEDLEKIKKEFQGVEPKKINTIPELITTLEKVQSAHKKLNQIQEMVKNKHQEIRVDFERVSNYTKQVDNWYKDDYRSILEKAKLPDLSVKNIGMMLFGGSVVNKIDTYLSTYEKIRQYMPKKSDKVKKEKRERLKGQDIIFPSRHRWPKLLIEKISLSGQTGTEEELPGLVMKGEVMGITSQPWIYGKPTVIDLNGVKQDQRALIIDGHLDHTTENFQDRFHIKFANVILNNLSMQGSNYLPSRIKKGRAEIDLSAEFSGEKYRVDLDILTREMSFDFSKMKTDNQFVDIVRKVIEKINIITLHAMITGQEDQVDFTMSSNLDSRISQELRQIGSQALTDAQNKVRSRLNKIKKEKLTEVNKAYQEKRKIIEDKIEEYEKKVDEQRMMVEAKIDEIKDDIEKREKEEQEKLEDKAKDMLDGLFDG